MSKPEHVSVVLARIMARIQEGARELQEGEDIPGECLPGRKRKPARPTRGKGRPAPALCVTLTPHIAK